MKCHKNSFKDKCDECGTFDYLKGINNKCLCPKCYNVIYNVSQENREKSIDNRDKILEIQLSIFDINNSQNSH